MPVSFFSSLAKLCSFYSTNGKVNLYLAGAIKRRGASEGDADHRLYCAVIYEEVRDHISIPSPALFEDHADEKENPELQKLIRCAGYM